MEEHSAASAKTVRARVLRAAIAAGALLMLVVGIIGTRLLTVRAAASPAFVQVGSSVEVSNLQARLATYHFQGQHNPNDALTVEIALQPNNQKVTALLNHLYTVGDPLYHHWLTSQQYEQEFVPKVDLSYFTKRGFSIHPSSDSPFLVNLTGTYGMAESAFGVTINNYRDSHGRPVYSYTSLPHVPYTLAGSVAGVIGLENAWQAHPFNNTPHAMVNGKKPSYGGGPGGNGLTPNQIRGIYNVSPVYATTSGQGKTLAVFELSEYTHHDISIYESYFGIPSLTPSDIYVDGGPCDPTLLQGAPCSYGAAEVELDIELQLAVAPKLAGIEVYNGPNSNQGVIDTYAKIAHDNTADAISTSWGSCEAVTPSSVFTPEYYAFRQMEAQGQSIFAAAGDNGAFDCLGGYAGAPYPAVAGTIQVDDPASDPDMTAVGGTSFLFTYDPAANQHPAYPTGKEYVWNTINACTNNVNAAMGPCPYGAGGGGDSRLWAIDGYQWGTGVINSYSRKYPFCSQKVNTYCREVPDISMNADPNSGYVIYCTDAGGGCPSAFGYYIGWEQYGGTSTAAPLWAGIAALVDGYHHARQGSFAFKLYATAAKHPTILHDIATGGIFTLNGKTYDVYSNGYFPTTKGYDMATGMGTPNVTIFVEQL